MYASGFFCATESHSTYNHWNFSAPIERSFLTLLTLGHSPSKIVERETAQNPPDVCKWRMENTHDCFPKIKFAKGRGRGCETLRADTILSLPRLTNEECGKCGLASYSRVFLSGCTAHVQCSMEEMTQNVCCKVLPPCTSINTIC